MSKILIESMKKVPRILLVEDSEGDAALIAEALENSLVQPEILVIDDGEEALAYLAGEGIFKDVPKPDLILLDVNLPKVDGKEILVFIKNHKELKRIPVIMLTTSSLQADIDFSYDNHANCYIVKSGDFKEFNKTISLLENFWFHSVRYANNI